MKEETKQEIIRLQRGGMTYPEIGRIVGYGLKSIQKVIGENAPELAKMVKPRVSSEKRKAVARDYYTNGLTADECMKKYGIGARAMNIIRLQFREEYGGKKSCGGRRTFSDEMLTEIRAEYEQGKNPRYLYEKYGINRSQLRLCGIIRTNSDSKK